MRILFIFMAFLDFSTIKSPPKFDGLNFPIWKVKMNLFLKSLGVRVARAITKEFVEPLTDERSWSEYTTKDYEANARAQYALTQVLNEDDLSRIINCKSAFEVWNVLIVTQRERPKLKDLKLTCFVLNMRTFICLRIRALMTCSLVSPK